MKIAILGAGITGLSIGYKLREKAPKSDFTLFESSDAVGGLMKSRHVNGFIHDLAGGHILYTKRSDLREHFDRLLDGQLIQSRRQTRIYWKGRYINYPFENGLGDLPRETNFRCLKGYVEAYMARKSGANGEPRNLREWILWRFGEGIAEEFMLPYNEKIWKSDLTDMSFAWVAGRVPDAPPDDVLRSAVGIRTEGYTHQMLFSYPSKGGFAALANATAEPIQAHIRLETPVEQVRRVQDGWEVNGEKFDRLVSTVPLPCVADFLDQMDPAVAEIARKLERVNLLCFLIGLDYPGRFPYSWIYFPHREDGPVNRLTHLSNYSPDNAPANCSSVMCEVTFRGDTAPEANASLRSIVDHLHETDIIDKDRIVATDISRVDGVYPYYSLDFEANVRTVRDYLDGIGFETCGRTGRLEYFNADHCVIAAFEFVDRILEVNAAGRVIGYRGVPTTR